MLPRIVYYCHSYGVEPSIQPVRILRTGPMGALPASAEDDRQSVLRRYIHRLRCLYGRGRRMARTDGTGHGGVGSRDRREKEPCRTLGAIIHSLSCKTAQCATLVHHSRVHDVSIPPSRLFPLHGAGLLSGSLSIRSSFSPPSARSR
jgi:hypothetical protein